MNQQLRLGTAALVAVGFCATASADSIVETWSCKVNDDKTIEDVQAVNGKWLKWINANVKSSGIESAVGTAVVGNVESFIFVDTYPDLATWAAAKDMLDSDAGDELDELFEGLSECSENRLWKIEDTEPAE